MPRNSREMGWREEGTPCRECGVVGAQRARECDALGGIAFGCLLPLSSLTRLYCSENYHFISDTSDTNKLCQTMIRI